MKSIYQDPEFAKYWEERCGLEGDDFKRFVLDPIMLGKIGGQENKVILEMGCGNGCLAPKFLELNPKQVILMDISQHNLDYAKNKTRDDRVSYLQQDITLPWNLDSDSIDLIYSNLVLNEIPTLTTAINESYRVLKPKGEFIFSILHPAFLLFTYAQQKAGKENNRFQNLDGYFDHHTCKYLMGKSSTAKTNQTSNVSKDYPVEQTQHTIQDYLTTLITAGFTIKDFQETSTNQSLIDHNPGYQGMEDRPIHMIIHVSK